MNIKTVMQCPMGAWRGIRAQIEHAACLGMSVPQPKSALKKAHNATAKLAFRGCSQHILKILPNALYIQTILYWTNRYLMHLLKKLNAKLKLIVRASELSQHRGGRLDKNI